MKASDSISLRCSTAYKEAVAKAAEVKGYRSTSDYVKDCISKDMYNKKSQPIQEETTNATRHNTILDSKAESASSSTSRAQVLEQFISNLERQSELAEKMGDTATALARSKEAGDYYKQLLDETKKPMSDDIKVKSVRKNSLPSKTARIEENDIEIIE